MPHADALRQLAGHAGFEQNTVLIVTAATHALSGVDVLLHGVLRKACGRDDGNFAAGKLLLDGKRLVRLVLFRHHAGDAAEMIDVGVRDDDGLDREMAEVLFDELHGGLAALHAHQRVKDDPARIALDDGKVGHVVAANLINAVGHLKKPVYMVVFGVLPQARIHAVGCFLVVIQKREGILTPNNPSVLVLQLQRFRCVNQTAYSKLIFLLVAEIQLVIDRRVCPCRILGSGLYLAVHVKPIGFRHRAGKEHRNGKEHRYPSFHQIIPPDYRLFLNTNDGGFPCFQRSHIRQIDAHEQMEFSVGNRQPVGRILRCLL